MKVQDLLSTEEKWFKGSLAVDEFGVTVGVSSRKAVQFCLEGAILKCYPGDRFKNKRFDITLSVRDLIDRKSKGRYRFISNWNDAPRRTFKQVRGLIEELDI